MTCRLTDFFKTRHRMIEKSPLPTPPKKNGRESRRAISPKANRNCPHTENP